MYPSFRGQKLNMNNYPAEKVEEIRFLIANKKPQIFELLIDKIILV
jgi:NADH dehydrogenase [ubiquinone] 1 alpha subcomplex assembly factor 1